jgi:dihydroorotase
MDELMGYSQRSGGRMMPHEGCKPQPLRRRDRAAVQRAVLSGNPKFFYGGDDAAHLKSNKECAHPACGCWNTIAALSLLIEFFMKHDKLELLEPFLSEYGARYSRYPLNEETVTFTLNPWIVPHEVPVPALGDNIVPFYAGEKVLWQIAD